MGLHCFFSGDHDDPPPVTGGRFDRVVALKDASLARLEAGVARAVGVFLPDPRKFTILRGLEIGVGGKFLLVEIEYHGCTNFEGRKILLYRGVSRYKLESQTVIDPHFSDGEKHIHPIARFVPTDDGWRMGILLATELAGKERR